MNFYLLLLGMSIIEVEMADCGVLPIYINYTVIMYFVPVMQNLLGMVEALLKTFYPSVLSFLVSWNRRFENWGLKGVKMHKNIDLHDVNVEPCFDCNLIFPNFRQQYFPLLQKKQLRFQDGKTLVWHMGEKYFIWVRHNIDQLLVKYDGVIIKKTSTADCILQQCQEELIWRILGNSMEFLCW